jgi:L-serine dehydratase
MFRTFFVSSVTLRCTMKTVSIFNHVLGPVMRGPSGSQTAGAFHIGRMARSLLGGSPRPAALPWA